MLLGYKKRYWLAAAVAAVLGLAIGTVAAHEGREVGDYRINVGWTVEPAYEGFPNGLEVRVIKVVESGEDDHHGDSMTAADDHHGDSGAVKGLENTLQLEVVYASTGASRIVTLSADPDEPGRYTADLIPSAPGVYEVRVFGAIAGTLVDETFTSEGGGGDFDDIQSPVALHFPEELPSAREMESAVRGAINTAEEARDAAEEGPGMLPVLALLFGISGTVLGVVGLVVGLRRR